LCIQDVYLINDTEVYVWDADIKYHQDKEILKSDGGK
jgi:hypothetical protein